MLICRYSHPSNGREETLCSLQALRYTRLLRLESSGVHGMKTTVAGVELAASVQEAKTQLDAHAQAIIEWHFSPETGCPFWLEFASKLAWNPRKEIRCFEDLKKFPPFEDEWLRGGPVRRWVPKGLAGLPVYVFETGGTTGVPKSRVAIED